MTAMKRAANNQRRIDQGTGTGDLTGSAMDSNVHEVSLHHPVGA